MQTHDEGHSSKNIMQRHTIFAIVAVASTVSVVTDVPVFAQSDTRAAYDAPAPRLQFALAASTSALRVYAGEPAGTSGPLPLNLIFPETLRPVINRMLDRSPTFRRQTRRIEQASTLFVRVVMARTLVSSRPKAFSNIGTTDDGRLVANVTVTPPDDLSEQIAHELEHVLEQLDGIDLRERASRSDSGVWTCVDGSFETRRAVRIGQTVASELDRPR